MSCNYFFADFYLGKTISESAFVHYPDEQWIDPTRGDSRRIVTGEIKFSGLRFPGLGLDGFDNHQRLLAAYSKLQSIKQRHAE